MEWKPAGDVRFRPLLKVRLLVVLLSFFAGLSQTLLAAPSVEGQWGPRINFTTVPISAAVLPNGKLLIFSSWDRYDFTSGNGARDKTYSNLYDPATGQVTEFLVTQTDHDMFCPGTAFLEDGRLLVNGGGPHVTTTSIYNFSANQWVRGASMSRRRWYNASTTLPGGGVFTLGGIPDDGVGELWTAGAGWSVLAGAPVTPMTMDAGSYMPRSEQHPKVLVAPNGKLFAAGPTPNMQWYDTASGGSVQFAGRRGDDIYAQNNVTLMFDVGKILTAGGSPRYDAGSGQPPASANAYVIDINSAVSTRKIAPMQHGRSYANGVVLPDGRVLVVGGNGTGKAFSDAAAVFVPEMFDPDTETWTPMATQATPRTYHSTALLLPDGRVFSGGGGLCGNCGVNHADGEVYSPPYLFQGPRPVIQGAPTVVAYNAPFSIATTGDVARFTFVRLSSTTHTVNTDQRFLPLASAPNGGGSFTVTSPLNANIAPPGYYMLFALSGTGVPSVSKIMKLSGAPVGGFRYVKLEEVSEVSGKAFGSAAELNVVDTSGNTIGRTGWVASADSAETASSPPLPAANAIDGKPSTLWHTRFVGASPPPPHWLVVDMGTSHPVGGFRYLPRQDGSSNGRIAGYRFYVSTDGVNWGTPVAQGTFANTPAEKTVTFGAAPTNQSAALPNQPPDALALDPIASPPQTAGTPVSYTAVPHGGVNPRFSWSFGDGTAATAPAATPGATHTFAQPGRYTVTVTSTDDVGAHVVRKFVQAVHHPLTATPPTVSMSIAYEDNRDRVWNVNPDNDTATVFDALTEVKIAEVAVGQRPRSVAVAPDGRIWVANQQSASISIIAPDTLQVVQTVDLPAASQPYGLVFDSAGSQAFVALESMGLLLRLSPTTGVETGRVAVGPNPRHLSVNAYGTRVFVSRFITPPVPGEASTAPNTSGRGGEIVVVDSSSLAIAKTVVLQHSEATDTSAGGRGIPNYLGPAVIAPDGRSAWVPSKQDNIKRGTLRDGRQLTFETTIRAISSRIDLPSLAEDYPARMDHDNSGVAATALFNPTSDYLFVALEASREVAVIDPYSHHELMRFNVGRAPQGLALSSDGSTLYVQNFMDRTVGVYDIETMVQTGDTRVGLIKTYSSVAGENLPAQVLLGKQLFYDARDPRLARDRYISCAACHDDGGHDGRVWDLSGSGEGLRNTISLRGHAGTAHGRLHWSSNFDEVQDFEQQIRGLAAGTGLMSDSDFNAGTRSQPLGDPKAGSSADLDALAAYVASLNTFAPSPHRNPDATLTADAAAGETVFQTKDCVQCHSGSNLTDSVTSSDTLHDIGTLKPSSGRRLGDTLTGIDTPTLRGVWASAPYLHDGSAATLSDAVSAHEGITVTPFELDRLSSYLQQLDSRTD